MITKSTLVIYTTQGMQPIWNHQQCISH